jgi:DNA-binding protein HU-beta
MNKGELVKVLAEKTDLSQKDVKTVVDAFIETIGESLKKGEEVRLIGFGTFYVKERKARTGIKPGTKEKIKIPAKKIPGFRPGSELKKLVDG